MNLENNKDGTAKVWLSRDEYRTLREVADDETELIIRLGAEVGLRHSETAAVRPAHLSKSAVDTSGLPTVDDGGPTTATWLAVYGKDTTGEREEGKRRDAFVPDDVARDLELYQHMNDYHEDDELFPSPRTIRRRISDLSGELAETHNPDWQYLSTHDLRRFYASQMLQVHSVNPEVLMKVGGWDSYQALRPYLQSPVEAVVVAELDGIDLA